MKSKASIFLKQVLSVISSMIKAKSMAMRSKTSAMKTRLIIFSLLKNKKVLMSTISHKMHMLLGHVDDNNAQYDESKAIVLYKPVGNASESYIEYGKAEGEDKEEDEYPDLRHSLFDSEGDEFDDQMVSVIDLVRNSKEDGKEFKLEDEIDQVADLFIRRFHQQMRMQKQNSIKRYQEMLDRSI